MTVPPPLADRFAPSNIAVPALGNQSLFGAFTKSIGAELSHFPVGPALTDDFWLLMTTWHVGLFLCEWRPALVTAVVASLGDPGAWCRHVLCLTFWGLMLRCLPADTWHLHAVGMQPGWTQQRRSILRPKGCC